MAIAEKAADNYYYRSNPGNTPEILTKKELFWLHNIKISRTILDFTIKPKTYNN
ncbi:MAG: hypothetical protein HY819_23410 [Acidobacteria bacterium]|nr:hypothetical protein [Acidobacteriota bacterium]